MVNVYKDKLYYNGISGKNFKSNEKILQGIDYLCITRFEVGQLFSIVEGVGGLSECLFLLFFYSSLEQ